MSDEFKNVSTVLTTAISKLQSPDAALQTANSAASQLSVSLLSLASLAEGMFVEFDPNIEFRLLPEDCSSLGIQRATLLQSEFGINISNYDSERVIYNSELVSWNNKALAWQNAVPFAAAASAAYNDSLIIPSVVVDFVKGAGITGITVTLHLICPHINEPYHLQHKPEMLYVHIFPHLHKSPPSAKLAPKSENPHAQKPRSSAQR